MAPTETTVRFQTVGCRLNQYETEKMATSLSQLGVRRVRAEEPADLYVINTCTVTGRADKDSRYLVRRAHRENAAAKVVLVGCYVETDPEAIAQLEGVDLVILNSEKGQLADILRQRFPGLFENSGQPIIETALSDFHQRNRAWIKVSDGCDQSCSYCLVTMVRGQLVCRPMLDIVREIQGLADHGYNEVVLTGVNIGHFMDSTATPPITDLAGLCEQLLQQTYLGRLRISSIEPQTVDERLRAVYADAAERICRHWHIPLQSGSDRILRLMRRPYQVAAYLKRLEQVKQVKDGAAIGADIIVGFPGETDQDFNESCAAADSGLLDYLHVFSYSDRPGTAAADMTDKVSPQVIRERVGRLKEISNRRWQSFLQSQSGCTLSVICENRKQSDGLYRAVADNYVRVKMPPDTVGGKAVHQVLAGAVHDGYVDAMTV